MNSQQSQFFNSINLRNETVTLIERPASSSIVRSRRNDPTRFVATQRSLDLDSLPTTTKTNLKKLDSSKSELLLDDPKNRMHLNDQQLNEQLSLSKSTHQQQQAGQHSQKLAAKSSSVLNAQSLRSQSLTTKNFFDYNFQTQQHMLILSSSNTSPTKSTTLDVIHLSNNNHNQAKASLNNPTLAINPHNPQQSHQSVGNSFNPKVINESNKFLENILTNNKRTIKQATSLNLLSPNSGNAQTVSVSANFSNHVNLPPTVITVSRTNEERFLFPDKLILESMLIEKRSSSSANLYTEYNSIISIFQKTVTRRNLNACPIIEGDDQLKLINYQHNQIRSISNLDQMRSLIFLDLYDNRIERINGLSTLINLRVLMLGKNRIEKIENLDPLVYLDVLDLHGNQISSIENLGSLHELRVLNVAANQIKVVENLNGLHSLVELNLRRNQIYEINELDHCTKLQRLFLSFNDIMSLMSIKNLTTINNLQELSLDNNPISLEKNYKRNVLAQIISLKKLDSKKVTDEEKRIAERMFLKSEFKKRELENYYFLEEKRKTIIRDAKSEWFAQQNDARREKTTFEMNSMSKEPNIVSLNANEIDSKYVLNDDTREFTSIEKINSKSFGVLANSSITFQKPKQPMSNHALLNYQNYLQQYQNQTQMSNSNKINAKLKIVTMRNIPSFPNQPQHQQQANIISNQNFNLISSSSSSSLHSNENNNESIKPAEQANQINNNETDELQQGDFQRAQAILMSRSSSASSHVSKLVSNTTNPTSNANNSATISVSNIRRSITYNSGSNIHEDSIMYFYGVKSLEILDNKLESNLTAQIMTISFHYIDFDENLGKNLARIKFKFPSVINLIFTCCNIKCLSQIDNLLEWKRLDSLTINKEDNPIFSISIWPHYTICRLNGLQLKKLNDKLISPDDVAIANKFLSTYLNWALFLPEYKLIAILGQDKKKLIKIAKEKFNDPNSTPTQEQINARETIIRAVAMSNNQLIKANLNSNTNNSSSSSSLLGSLTPTSSPVTEKKSLTNPNQTFVNNVVSQMNYNDYKKQKIKSLEPEIWQRVTEQNLKNSIKKEKHISTICEKKKIHI